MSLALRWVPERKEGPLALTSGPSTVNAQWGWNVHSWV